MSKLVFMRELESLLLDISLEERQEALQYYEGYFEDAGPEREQTILVEIGSPQKVAACIKADLNSSTGEAQSRGYFTENGYEDGVFREPKFEIMEGTTALSEPNKSDETRDNLRNDNTSYGNSTKYNNTSYGNSSKNNNTSYSNSSKNNNTSQSNNTRNEREEQRTHESGSNIGLIILLCIFAIPIGVPVFSLFFTAFLVIVSFWLAFVIIAIVFILVGVGLTAVGLIKIFTMPLLGISFTGAGLILFGLGLLFCMATIGLSKKVLPSIFRGFINVCSIPFKNRRTANA